MHYLKLVGFSVLSGLLMGLSWPATGNMGPLFFVALIPLLYVEYYISQNPKEYKARHLFFLAYVTFIVFNTFSTWWIYYSTSAGMVMAEVLNSLFMATVFLWFHGIKKRLGNNRGYFSLIMLWIGFEWLHYNWELSHPWSSFGNTLANYVYLTQWYEYTGVFGGSLWILLVNILIFNLAKKLIILKDSIKNNLKLLLTLLGTLLIPLGISVLLYNNNNETENSFEIVIAQPNIDPYTEKFGGMTEAEQIDRILSLARTKITPNTDFVVVPETAIPRGSLELEFEQNYGIIEIRKLISEFPKIKFIVGISSYIEYPLSEKKPTPTARFDKQTGGWYDAFNTGILIDKTRNIQIYHKSKLVLGVEKLPFPKLLSPFEDLALNLGGTIGSLGTENESKNFLCDEIDVAPLICYESIYGEYVGSYVKKGADLICIITNDGWWSDSPGYWQHLSYARLRAIENRRSIARSANTGISCFINQRGQIIDQTKGWEQAVIRGNINANNKITFYSENGDVIGRVSAFFAVLLLLWGWTLKIKKPKF